jgi:hypothetical protein
MAPSCNGVAIGCSFGSSSILDNLDDVLSMSHLLHVELFCQTNLSQIQLVITLIDNPVVVLDTPVILCFANNMSDMLFTGLFS